jgi:hypothetical protein
VTLVVIGANPTVAKSIVGLPEKVIHVQSPDALALDASVLGDAGILTADFLDISSFLLFVADVLKPLVPSAIVSITELGLEPAAAAAELLGVRGVALEVVRNTRDKLAMRQVLKKKAPHLNADFASGDDPGAVARLFSEHARVVAKPVDGVGSEAVSLLLSIEDLPEDRRVAGTLLEQFLGGLEFSVETLSSGGQHAFMGIAEKGTTGGFVEVSHIMPPPSLDSRRQSLVTRAVGELLDAIGITEGPSHTEVKVDGDQVTVIETHTRLGGDGIADLVRLTTGINWRKAAVGWPIGAALDQTKSVAAAAATVFFTAPPGRVASVAERPALNHGSIVEWDIQVQPGDAVRPLKSSGDRLGMAILTASTPADCKAAVAEVLNEPTVRTHSDRSPA